MIQGVHALFYSDQAVALREFLRDKLKIPFTDVGEGWLIFDLPEGDVGVHPTDHPGSPKSGAHNVSFYCDDLEQTVAELKANGVQFSGGIDDRGYGLVTHFVMPGNVEVELYQPRYQKNPRPALKAKTQAKASSAKKAVKRAVAKVKRTTAKPKARVVKKLAKAKAKASKR